MYELERLISLWRLDGREKQQGKKHPTARRRRTMERRGTTTLWLLLFMAIFGGGCLSITAAQGEFGVGVWSDFQRTEWSACSAKCGGVGQQTRQATRRCTRGSNAIPRPFVCDGRRSTVETRTCTGRPCGAAAAVGTSRRQPVNPAIAVRTLGFGGTSFQAGPNLEDDVTCGKIENMARLCTAPSSRIMDFCPVSCSSKQINDKCHLYEDDSACERMRDFQQSASQALFLCSSTGMQRLCPASCCTANNNLRPSTVDPNYFFTPPKPAVGKKRPSLSSPPAAFATVTFVPNHLRASRQPRLLSGLGRWRQPTFEIQDLTDDGFTKRYALTIFPYQLEGAVAAYLEDENTILVCGGDTNATPPKKIKGYAKFLDAKDLRYHDGCFKYSKPLKYWIQDLRMATPRTHPAATWTPKGWWITGGSASPNLRLKSTEMLTADGTAFVAGPDLPNERYAHCILNLGEDTMIIGGNTGARKHTADVYIYSWTTGQWRQLPNFPGPPREVPACTQLQSGPKSGHILLAAGYDKTLKYLAHTATFDLNTERWTKLAPLPTKSVLKTPGTHSASFKRDLTRDGSLHLVDLHHGVAWEFDEDVLDWKEPHTELKTSRHFAIELSVPKKFWELLLKQDDD